MRLAPALKRLELLAVEIRSSRTDRKSDEFARLLQDSAVMRDSHGERRVLIVFTEHRYTLNYLTRPRLAAGRVTSQ